MIGESRPCPEVSGEGPENNVPLVDKEMETCRRIWGACESQKWDIRLRDMWKRTVRKRKGPERAEEDWQELVKLEVSLIIDSDSYIAIILQIIIP